MADKIEEKALALWNAVREERGYGPRTITIDRVCQSVEEALCRAIEAHEADKQAFSDAVEALFSGFNDAYCPWTFMHNTLDRFIIKKPDPLREAMDEAFSNGARWSTDNNEGRQKFVDATRQALAARGLKIVEATNAPL